MEIQVIKPEGSNQQDLASKAFLFFKVEFCCNKVLVDQKYVMVL